MERCQSGRMGHPAKVLAVKTARGFESLPLRQVLHSAKLKEFASAGQTIFLGFWICPASAFFPPAGGVWGGMRAGF